MVATVKIIPFAIAPRRCWQRCAALLAAGPLVRVAPFRPLARSSDPDPAAQRTSEGAGQDRPDHARPPRRRRRASCTATRAAPTSPRRWPRDPRRHGRRRDHAADRRRLGDHRPARRDPGRRSRAAGGEVQHFGMPVDPGNLLLLGRLGRRAGAGPAGLRRSPKLNGFDWVLERLAAGSRSPARDIMRMGVGGLLDRDPVPAAAARERGRRRHRAPGGRAGAGRRAVDAHGRANKLLCRSPAVPMVAPRVEAALASRAAPVIVVLGHQAARGARRRCAGQGRASSHNPDFAEGLSTSLRAGLAALPADVDGAVVVPRRHAAGGAAPHRPADRRVQPAEGRAIVVPTWRGKRGNPVLWARLLRRDAARRGRCRRPAPDRRARRRGGRGRDGRRRGPGRHRHARGAGRAGAEAAA